MQRLTGLLEITAAFFGAAVAAGPAASAAVAAALGCDARSCCSERQPKSGKASTAWYLMLLLQLLLLLQLQLLLLLFLLVSPLLPAALFLPLPSASASLQMYVDISMSRLSVGPPTAPPGRKSQPSPPNPAHQRDDATLCTPPTCRLFGCDSLAPNVRPGGPARVGLPGSPDDRKTKVVS